ncbi:hypothetical protein SASPL_122395 [Salvia splendens]|uniref:Gibberellin receptor GID1 n=1 Tax=Salvia splendens TaxID=180675 RepID=A0A8X8XJ88_SALSN|nr:hypothetical protein SASPL_122395 [Salvia splendens]
MREAVNAVNDNYVVMILWKRMPVWFVMREWFVWVSGGGFWVRQTGLGRSGLVSVDEYGLFASKMHLAGISRSSSSSHSPLSIPSPILYDIYPFIRVYKNGTIQRFIGQDFSPPSTDPATGVQSKDVHFSHLSARLYLPKNPAGKLPLLIYFHGGGFFTESAFSPTYHRHLTFLQNRRRVRQLPISPRAPPSTPPTTMRGSPSNGHSPPGSEAGLDDPLVNPEMDPGLGRVLVYVAGKDVLRFIRGRVDEEGKEWGWERVLSDSK